MSDMAKRCVLALQQARTEARAQGHKVLLPQDSARVMFGTLREPTEAMTWAGKNAVRSAALDPTQIRAVWRAMLDEAMR